MHVCDSRSDVLINAEVDSMGGVVDGGVGNGIKTSPRRAAIERAQTELRQEYDVREERRRELEFLEKGGNPLDFKFGNTASISVQSTSLTDHQVEHVVTSKAKGSFALTASTHGDSVESSGQPGPTSVCEPNSADNFDGQTNLLGGERNRRHISRRNSIAPSQQSSRMEGTQNAKESEDSAIVRPYARRNRSRPNRDGARTSADVVKRPGGHGSSLPIRGGSRNTKLTSESNNQKDNTVASFGKPKPTISNGEMLSHIVEVKAPQQTDAAKSSHEDKLDVREPKSNVLKDKEKFQPAEADAQKQETNDAIRIHDEHGGNEKVVSAGHECSPCSAVERSEVEAGSAQLNDLKANDNVIQNGGTTNVTKGLDSDSSCTPNSLSLDVNNGGNLSISCREDDSIRVTLTQAAEVEGKNISGAGETGKDRNDTIAVENNASGAAGANAASENASANGMAVKVEEDIKKSSDPQTKANCISNLGETYENEIAACQELPKIQLPEKSSASSAEPHSCPDSDIKMDRAREDSILEEARSIEAKRKRIAELSVRTAKAEICNKSHWDFVLEEMEWLANDFAQERLWKMTAAAQICRRAANTSRLRVDEQIQRGKLKKMSYTMAKAVMQFWQSAEAKLLPDKSPGPKIEFDENKPAEGKDASKDFEQLSPRKNGIQGYAMRFLKFNISPVPVLQAEQPATPDLIGDTGVKEVSWDDHLTEESLFYAVPSGAIDSYRRSIESHLVQFEKTGSSLQEDDDTSMLDAGGDFGYTENGYEEDEGETSTYYVHGAFEGSRRKKHEQKKRKHFMKSFPTRSYEVGADVLYGTVGPPQNTFFGKRPASNLGPIPPKRMRTASRQRVIGPFSTGVTAGPSGPAKTGASSGDTSSFQDDQNTLHGGSQIQKGMEVDSVAEFEKRLTYDCSDAVTKPKKKKKARHLGSAYEQSWQLDSTTPVEQREDSRKRPENHHFESNGTSGAYGQHAWKKPKMLKQSVDAFDNVAPMTGSIPSPAASQMSNMPSTNRFMRLINGRDKGRKAKSLKQMSSGQPGFGSSWSLFEDQALVVLVHDMGPNWELVSDAINSTLHFKCIFRAPKECKERHKILMDKGDGDGADSAEDSGTSQSYPSTLPGIPKGSARQLFQRLQGPMEEEAIKSHFEKIIMIGKKLHYRRSQNDNQDPKHIPVHNSHVIALSQAFPNNLNGGVLTPIELIDMNPSSPDAHILGYQGSHTSGLPMASQGVVGSILPAPGANPSAQGSSGMVLGNNSPSPSGPLPASARDVRFNSPRTSLRANEHPRMQQYNQMLPRRNMQQQSNQPVSGHLPGGNSMGMMHGLNRGMPLSRPGFQGMASPVQNSSSMLSSSVAGIPGGVNMQSGTGSGQPNSLIRPREQLHMMRPYSGHPHQMSPQQSNAQQAYAIRVAKEKRMQQQFLQQSQQQQFAASSTHMAHVQPSPQIPMSSLPMKTPQISQQTSSPPVSLPPMTQASPMLGQVQQQKVNLSHHGVNRNPQGGATSGLANPMVKQRQRQQQFQQPGRNHPQQRHPAQLSQQKLVKGASRGGNMLVHQNPTVDRSHMNGISIPVGSKGAEKGGDQVKHLMQGKGLYSGSGLAQPSQTPSSKPVVSPQSSNHPQPQQKQFPASSKHLQQKSSHSDNSSQGQQVPSSPAGHVQPGSHQAATSAITAPNQQHQKQVNQSHSTVQRMLKQNSLKNPSSPIKSQRQYEQQPLNNVSQIGVSSAAAAIPTGINDSANAVLLDTGVPPPCKVSDPSHDSAKPNPASQVGSIGSSPPLRTSSGTEPVASISHGLGQRQLSGGLSQQGQNAIAKRQQQPELQSAPPPTTTTTTTSQPEEQLPQQEHHLPPLKMQQPSDQQTHHQTVEGGLYSRPTTDAKLE
ncbi:Chromatin modification-related protein EAF1 A [Linum perenne]